jgi:hypothetical protein
MAIFLISFFIGRAMGDSEIFSGLFFGKLLLCFGTLGVVLGIDRFMPIKWE